MKKIVLMCLSKKGAGPAFILSMARGFCRDAKNQVYCILSSSVENRNEWIEQEKHGVRILYLETGNTRTFIMNSLKFMAKGKRQVRSFFNNESIDVCIQTLVHPWMFMLSQWISPRHLMAVIHDPVPHTGEKLVNILISKIMYRFTPEIIVMTKSFIPLVEQLYQKKRKSIYYMRHGIYDSYRKYVQIPEMEKVSFGAYNLLFFGRIEEYKGLDILLDAYGELSDSDMDVTLTIAGNGDISPYRQRINSLRKVNLINRYIRDEEIGALFSIENAILVVPYKDATQSGVIPIAIDFNVPVIASGTGGLVEQLDDGNIGMFAEPGNVGSLVNALKNFIGSSELQTYEKINIEQYKRKLEWDVITSDLLVEIDHRESGK